MCIRDSYQGIPQAYYSIDQHAPRGKVEFYEDERFYDDRGPWHEYKDFAPNTDDNICHKYILKIEDQEEVTVTENYGGTK